MIKSMSMSSFKEIYQEQPLNLIDVREKEEFESGHIPGAQNLPLSELQFGFQTLDKDKDYFIVCQSGSRSLMASQFLGANGYKVTNIEGGTNAWTDRLD